MNIYLDDIRIPKMSHNKDSGLGENYSKKENWIIVRDYFEFKKLIDNNLSEINLISFDHDLASFDHNKEFTGKDAVNYLIEKLLDTNIEFPNWYVHSDNTSGRKNIIGIILSYLKSVENKDISNFRYHHKGMYNGEPI